MKVQVVRPSDLGPPELRLWAEWQRDEARLASPFLTPTFARTAGTVNPRARVAVVEDAGATVAFWPYSAARSGAATSVMPGCADIQGLVHRPGLEWEWPDLLARAGVHGWRFDHLVAYQAEGLAGRLRAGRDPVLDLSSGWEGYEKWLRSEHKGVLPKMRSRLRRAQRDHDFVFEVGDTAPDALGSLMAQKSAQCRARGWVDVFAPRSVRELVERLIAADNADMTGMVSTIRLDGSVAAAAVFLEANRVRAQWFCSYDPAFSSLGPGLMLTLQAVEEAARSGVTAVTFGKGDEDFKQVLSQSYDPLVAGSAPARGPSGRWFALRSGPSVAASSLFARVPAAERAAREAVQSLRRARRRRLRQP